MYWGNYHFKTAGAFTDRNAVSFEPLRELWKDQLKTVKHEQDLTISTGIADTKIEREKGCIKVVLF